MIALYIILTFLITGAGTISGMGGGVFLKPLLDAFSGYDALTINALVTVTVFAMAVVSLIRSIILRKQVGFSFLSAAALGAGGVAGGISGQTALELFARLTSDSAVKLTQNIVLTLLVILVLIYNNQKAPKKLEFKSAVVFLTAGIFLGFSSIFFRAPINVALLMFLFGMNIKKAAVYSLVLTLFSQGSTLITIAFSTGFAVYDLSVLPYMAAAAVVGSVIGILINMKLNERAVRILFNIMQSLVACAAIYNIIIFSLNI